MEGRGFKTTGIDYGKFVHYLKYDIYYLQLYTCNFISFLILKTKKKLRAKICECRFVSIQLSCQ